MMFHDLSFALSMLMLASSAPEVRGVETGTYVVVTPSSFYPGLPLTVAVTIHNPGDNRPTDVSVKLQERIDGSYKDVGSNNVAMNSGESKLLSLEAPSDMNSDSKYNIEVKGTGGLQFIQNRRINLMVNSSVILVQTDKNIYKPGQLVRYRILNLDKDMAPLTSKVTVFILNTKGSKLERFNDLSSPTGVISKTFQLSPYASLGNWAIQIVNDKEEILHTNYFKVDEYVLPKFSVEVTPDPGFMVFNAEKYKLPPAIVVKSIYTYGKAVQGVCTMTLGQEGSPKQARLSQKISESGTVEFVDIDWNDIIGQRQPEKKIVLLAQVSVKDVMGRTESSNATIDVYRGDYSVEILPQSPDILHSGMKTEFYIKISDHLGSPATGQEATVRVEMQGMSPFSVKVQMEEGKAFAAVRFTPVWSKRDDRYLPVYESQATGYIEVQLTSDELTNARKELHWYISKAFEDVRIQKLVDTNVAVGGSETFQVDTTSATSKDTKADATVYMVVSQGVIVQTGRVENQKVTLDMTFDMCPRARLVVYQLISPKDVVTEDPPELVADSMEFSPSMCFDKEVSVSFDSKMQRTGTSATLKVNVMSKGASNSMVKKHDVFYLGVDKSITLLEGDTVMNEKRALDALDATNTWKDSLLPLTSKAIFASLNVDIATDATIAEIKDEPEIVWMEAAAGGEVMDDDMVMRKNSVKEPVPDAVDEGKVIKDEKAALATKVRKNFPDTWLWGSGETSENGLFKRSFTLPDTITSWFVSAFAINEDGLAVSGKPFEITAFKPFFLSLNLPYAIKRGEEFTLRITVFNYLEREVKAIVKLENSDDFDIKGGQEKDNWREFPLTLPPTLASSVEFVITATMIGKINFHVMAQNVDDLAQSDVVERKLLVKPPGVEREIVTTDVMKLTDSSPLTRDFNLDWGIEEIVNGSKRVQFKVTGQVMGQSLTNLNRLVTVPTGCGEQNMITVVPNIYGVTYIESTAVQDTDLVDAMKENMKLGYQRQVDLYKKADGSYSAWASDKIGSTWLTAFVMKSFAAADKFITVDSTVLTDAMTFIKSKNIDGLFKEDGRVLHSEMQAGTGKKFGLTVYCLLSILETGEALGDSNMDNALTRTVDRLVLEARAIMDQTSKDNPFLPSIMVYALSLVKNPSSDVQSTITNLLAFIQESNVPWLTPPQEGDTVPRRQAYAQPTLLMTGAYTLMAYLKRNELVKALPVMKWLQTQQNSRGGFGTTQDTVLVLQALAEYGLHFKNVVATGKVEVAVPGTSFSEDIDISGGRSILLQILDLPLNASQVKVTLKGDYNSVAVVKVVQVYNTPLKEIDLSKVSSNAKTVQLSTKSRNLDGAYHEIEACVQSTLQPGAGMYVASINPPSFVAFSESVETMTANNPGVSLVEVEEDAIHFYMNDIPKEGYCVKAKVERQMDFEVQLPGAAKFYSYYEPEYVKESPVVLSDHQECFGSLCDNSAAVSLTSLLLTVCICFVSSLLACI